MLKRLSLPVIVLVFLGSLFAQVLTSDESSRPARGIAIRRIVFQNARLLSSGNRLEISRILRNEKADAGSSLSEPSGLADEAAERVRLAYQDDGYFKAEVDAKPVPVAGEAARFDVVVEVRVEGKQYRFGDLRFVHVKAFPEPQLRDLFSLQRDEVFSRQKIVKGLENLRRLYGSEGYMNFTAVPNIEFDEARARVNLQVDIDEDRPFHWGHLHVEGMREQDSDILLKAWEGLRAQTYSSDRRELDRFLRKFFQPLRKGTSLADCAIIETNDVAGTVDVYISLFWNPDIITQARKTTSLAP